ncbi:MAG TPA: hypothetical protein VHA13_00945 [Gammaproteobacteria bacterium]|nr:hypothetical protein [Gammaproteobacteria bacterium]
MVYTIEPTQNSPYDMTEQINTTRTCSSCGKKKPLVAFLELSGSKVHSYGEICADCRGTRATQKKSSDIESGGTSGTIRAQLDYKARMKTEQEKVQFFKEREEEDYEEKMKKENLHSEEEQAEASEKEDKKHRESYQGDDLATSEATETEILASENAEVYQEEALIQHEVAEKENAQKENATIQAVNKEEVKKSSTDLSVTFLDDPTATLKRSGGSIFSQFRQMLGESAAINRSMRQYINKNAEAKKQKTGLTSSTFLKEPAKEKPVDKEQKVTEFINNNFKKR